MRAVGKSFCFGLFLIAALGQCAGAQRALTWQEVRDKFEAANPTLRAGQIGIDESRAQEITANVRPNPSLSHLGGLQVGEILNSLQFPKNFVSWAIKLSIGPVALWRFVPRFPASSPINRLPMPPALPGSALRIRSPSLIIASRWF